MKKYFWTLSIMALFAVGFAASDDAKDTTPSETVTETISESANTPSEVSKERAVENKSEVVSSKAVNEIKDIEELRQAINNTVWTHTTNGDAWFKLEFVGNTVKQYGALPSSGEWRYDGDSQFELKERRSDYDGKKYIVATFMPKAASLSMFELPVMFNFRDYHLYLNGQDLGGFSMSDYEWD